MPRPPCAVDAGMRPRSRLESCAAWDDRLWPSSSSRSSSRVVGPEMPRAATTSPRGPWTGTATPVSPTSSSSRVTAQPRLRARAPSRRRASGSASGGVGEPLEPVLRHGERAPGVEDLAERRGVGGDLDLGPVAGAEQEAGVDLRHLDDLLAAGHREVDGLVGLLAELGHRRPGQPDQLLPRVVAGGVQPEQAARDVGAGGVPLQQSAALEGGQHPRGRRLRQPARLLEVGEAQRLVGVHHRRHQLRRRGPPPGCRLRCSGRPRGLLLALVP